MATAQAPHGSTASSEPVPAPTVVRPGPGRLHDRPYRGVGHALPYLLPAFLPYGLFVLWPLLQLIRLAFYRWDGYGPQVFRGLGNAVDLARDANFRTALGHSLEWEVGAMLGGTALALVIALVAWRSRGCGLLLTMLFFPALVPATVVAAIWILVYSPASGLLDAVLRDAGLGALARGWLGDPGVALPALFVAWLWSSLGIGVLLFSVALRRIGREYLDLALIEGAGRLQRFRYVILPGVRRLGGVVMLVNVALAAQVFDLVYATTGGGPGYATLVLPLDMYARAFGGQTGEGAAVGLAQVLLLLGLVALALPLVRGGPAPLDDGGSEDSGRRASALSSLPRVLIAAPFLLPIGWLVVVALGGVQLQPGVSAATVDPRTWQWDSFRTAWDAGMAGAFGTSLLLAVAVVVVTVAVSAPAAFALTRLVRGRIWKAGMLTVLVVGLFQPTPALVIPLFWLLKDLGLLATPWGVLLPEIGRAIPFGVLVLWAALVELPPHVLEAAEVDGATPRQQMLRIALPLVRPALLVVAIWAMITSWNEYLLPTLVSQDGSLQTVPTLLATFVGRSDTEYAALAAGSIIAMLPALAVYLVFRRTAGRSLAGLERRVER